MKTFFHKLCHNNIKREFNIWTLGDSANIPHFLINSFSTQEPIEGLNINILYLELFLKPFF